MNRLVPASSADNVFWWEEAPPQELAELEIKPYCDVAIIGGGYTGLTAALTLLKAGKSVQVFDALHLGEAASSRNGGITSGSLRFGLRQAIKAFGEERGVGIHLEAIEARVFLGKLIQEYDIDCDYKLNGILTGFLTAKDFENRKREVDFANERLGSNTRIIEKNQLSEFTSIEKYKGAVLHPDIGTIQPAKLQSGLLQAAQKSGALVHGMTRVERVGRSADGFEIRSARGTCIAADVIVATNGYGDKSNSWLQKRIVPVTSRIVVTEELSPNLVSALFPGERAMGESRKLFHYFRPTPDGKRILLGGREPAWSRERSKAVDHVSRTLKQLFPDLKDVRVSHSWSGNVAFSRAQLPLMFRQSGIHYAVGYCGSGTVWAPWCGYKTALRILGEPAAKSQFQTRPPASVPFYRGKPWFLPLVLSSFEISDRMSGRA